MTGFVLDSRLALRSLARSPGFAAAAILTLAVGIGAATVMGSVFNAVLVRSLPFAGLDRLVMLWGVDEELGWEFGTFSRTEYDAFKGQAGSFDGLGAFESYDFNLRATGEPERVAAARADATLFDVLGVRPALGRLFTIAEAERGERLAVLSHGMWLRQFGGAASVVGQGVTLHPAPSGLAQAGARATAESYTIVGVLPIDFRLPTVTAELWIPLPPAQDGAESPAALQVIGRLAAGASPDEALAEIRVVHARVRQAHPEIGGQETRFVSLRDHDVGDLQATILLVVVAVAFLLLIAASNVAGLLLGRAVGRRGEMGIRVALGASRGRLLRQMLTESALLAALGGGLATLLAAWSLPILVRLSPGDALSSRAIGLDPTTLGVAGAATLLTAILLGLAPGLWSSQSHPWRALATGRDTAPVGGSARLRRWLVVSEVALAAMLLVAAGLIARSFHRLRGVDPGFDASHVLTAQVALSQDRYPGRPERETFFNTLLERVRALPGVHAAGATTILPLTSGDAGVFFTIEGRPITDPSAVPTAGVRLISPGYLEAMRIPVVRGRVFQPGPPPTELLMSEAMARRFWPGEDPVGRRIKLNRPEVEGPWLPIVGVVQDVRHAGPTDQAQPTLYIPRLGQPAMTIAVRTAGDPLALVSALRAEVATLDPDQPLHDLVTLEQRLSLAIAPERFRTLLVVLFSATALSLATLGLYAVLAAWVAQRVHEIGVRMAVGAGRAQVLRLVLWQGMKLALLGLGAGLGGALILARFLASLLFEIDPFDPWVFLCAPALIAGVAALACSIPAWRATRVDPSAALRAE